MSKLLYFFIIFLSTHNVFGASCGHELNVVVKYDPSKKHAELLMFNFVEEEFCDSGLVEDRANIQIELITDLKKVYTKKIFINEHTELEAIKPKSKEFAKNKPSFEHQFRNIKFSIEGAFSSLKKYRVIQLKDNKIIGEGAIK